MKPERWSRVEQLFHSALNVEESRRPDEIRARFRL